MPPTPLIPLIPLLPPAPSMPPTSLLPPTPSIPPTLLSPLIPLIPPTPPTPPPMAYKTSTVETRKLEKRKSFSEDVNEETESAPLIAKLAKRKSPSEDTDEEITNAPLNAKSAAADTNKRARRSRPQELETIEETDEIAQVHATCVSPPSPPVASSPPRNMRRSRRIQARSSSCARTNGTPSPVSPPTSPAILQRIENLVGSEPDQRLSSSPKTPRARRITLSPVKSEADEEWVPGPVDQGESSSKKSKAKRKVDVKIDVKGKGKAKPKPKEKGKAKGKGKGKAKGSTAPNVEFVQGSSKATRTSKPVKDTPKPRAIRIEGVVPRCELGCGQIFELTGNPSEDRSHIGNHIRQEHFTTHREVVDAFETKEGVTKNCPWPLPDGELCNKHFDRANTRDLGRHINTLHIVAFEYECSVPDSECLYELAGKSRLRVTRDDSAKRHLDNCHAKYIARQRDKANKDKANKDRADDDRADDDRADDDRADNDEST
ncbi:hypothetical protein PHLCEN_2v7588 [Hermanssonia centrifuga]|uniref:Uncharacterized protein n=1 Tax=Hermanssonia centrifuga TaxID=98765 RepID=A0A2R6NW56_9APHY|nr:hypothetical protein PHLCEN_2v7588 [Hermanssonia centrifuga]